MSARVEAGTKALWERSHDTPFSAASEGFKAPYRRESEAVIAASDAILFGDAAIDRAAAALNRECVLPWAQQPDWVKDAERAHVRAVIQALVGD